MTLTLGNFKEHMIHKAQKQGLYENFGQRELDRLKVKYGYNPYGSFKERAIVCKIDGLSAWASNFDRSQIP